jgi:cysteinyl-tRNA synthetase
MVEKHLPDGADIHGGGTDLRFPHHENELAQSAGAHPEHTFVRAWAHHGMVNIVLEGQISNKMAKSLGNVLDVERAVKLHGRNALRMWLLQSHYSQPIDYSEEILEEKKRSYERLLRFYRQISHSETSSELSGRLASELEERFDLAMHDDFNTPEAVAALFEVTGRAGQEIAVRPDAAGEFGSLARTLREVLTIFGFDLREELVEDAGGVHIRVEVTDTLSFGDAVSAEMFKVPEETMEKVRLRDEARRKKDWTLADRLRDELHAEGWAIEDTPEGPIVSCR